LNRYEFQLTSPLRNVYSAAAGYPGEYDHLRTGRALREMVDAEVRYVIVNSDLSALDTAIDTLRARLYRIGFGKLVTVGHDGSERFYYGRVKTLPDIEVVATRPRIVPQVIPFRLHPTAYGAVQTLTHTFNASGATWVVNNPGSIEATEVTVRLRSNSAAGFTNPKLINQTNGYVVQSNRDAISVNSEIKLDPSVPAIYWSDNDGASYVDDFANYVEQPLQSLLSFVLEPGNNTIELQSAGVVSLDVVLTFNAPYL